MPGDNFPEIVKRAVTIKNFLRRHSGTEEFFNTYNLYHDLLTEINQNSDLKNNFNNRDLQDFFTGGFSRRKSLFQMTPNEFESELKQYLYKKPVRLKYYFRVSRDYQFIVNKRIGTGSIRAFSKLPRVAKEELKKQYKYEYDRRPWSNAVGEAYEKLREKDYYMYIPVESRGLYYSNDEALRLFHENNAIFYFFTLSVLSTIKYSRSVYCALDEKYMCRSIGPGSDQDDDAVQSRGYFTDKIPIINKLLAKNQKNEIEKSIVRAIDVVGSVEVKSNSKVIFSLCMNAMENLLTGDQRGDLRYKTSERMAFLLGNNEHWIRFNKKISKEKHPSLTKNFISRHLAKSRYDLFRTVNDLYTKRSKFVHLEQKQQISEDDYYKAKLLLLLLVEKLLSLLNQNITHCNSKPNNDTASIEHVVNQLKFK